MSLEEKESSGSGSGREGQGRAGKGRAGKGRAGQGRAGRGGKGREGKAATTELRKKEASKASLHLERGRESVVLIETSGACCDETSPRTGPASFGHGDCDLNAGRCTGSCKADPTPAFGSGSSSRPGPGHEVDTVR